MVPLYLLGVVHPTFLLYLPCHCWLFLVTVDNHYYLNYPGVNMIIFSTLLKLSSRA